MDKDFDKLQEFVEIMKVSIYWSGSILEMMEGEARACPAATRESGRKTQTLWKASKQASTKQHESVS